MKDTVPALKELTDSFNIRLTDGLIEISINSEGSQKRRHSLDLGLGMCVLYSPGRQKLDECKYTSDKLAEFRYVVNTS